MVTADGVRLSVREYGCATAANTVVLLHGMCLDKAAWSFQVAHIIRECGNSVRVIAYDHRGHGDSDSAPMHTYRIERLADDLAHVLTVLGVAGHLTLAGHSMGGMTALAYLGRPMSHRPVEPENLVLIGTTAGKVAMSGAGRLLSTSASDLLYTLVNRAPKAVAESAARALSPTVWNILTRYGSYGEDRRNALVAVSAGTINATPLTTKVGFLRGIKQYDQQRVLSAITAKTTVISGGVDKLIPPSHAHNLVRAIPGATHLHQATAGHMLLHEVPRLVSQAIIGGIVRRSAAC